MVTAHCSSRRLRWMYISRSRMVRLRSVCCSRRTSASREMFTFVSGSSPYSTTWRRCMSANFCANSREFAQKFADMQRRHVVLYGDDPLTKVNISREALVRRLQQTLLNLTMRLREMYIQRSLREEQCAVTIADATGPLRAAAASILELEGRGTLAPKEALYTFVHDLGPSDFIELLPHLSEAREKRV